MTSLDCRVAALQKPADLRHNVLTGQAEFRPKGEERTPFRSLTDRPQLAVSRRARSGHPCRDRDVNRYVSLRPPSPTIIYRLLQPLAWDGRERLNGLARRVAGNPLWRSSFRRWMLAMTAHWDGAGQPVMPTVCNYWSAGSRAERTQSSFCRSLLPPELAAYYTDSGPDMASHRTRWNSC